LFRKRQKENAHRRPVAHSEFSVNNISIGQVAVLRCKLYLDLSTWQVSYTNMYLDAVM